MDGQQEDALGINHGPDAIRAMQYVADFFVNAARGNTHRYPSLDAEEAALMYNYEVQGTTSQAAYYFPASTD